LYGLQNIGLKGGHVPWNQPHIKTLVTNPNANSAQMLVWRPSTGEPLCIIQPVWKKDEPIGDQVVRLDPLCKLWMTN
jgi:hypothetical protein